MPTPDRIHAHLDREAAVATGTDPAALERVAALFESQLAAGTHPGAGLAVRRAGQLVLAMAGGTMRPGKPGPPVDPTTLFLIFSATKPFTSVAIHQLAERGRLDIDAPVAEYWPAFAQLGKASVTIHHVLTHQGGFPIGPKSLDWPLWRDLDAVARAMEDRPVRWEPGTDVGYHPLNYGWVLGEVVRRVDGRPLGAYLAAEVFAPLGLRDTWLGLPAEQDARVAHLTDLTGENAFVHDFNRPEVHAVQCGAATGITTPADLTRFYSALARGGEIDGVRILGGDMLARATRCVIDGQVDRTLQVPVRWARGFHLGGPISAFGRTSSPRAFGHSGHGSCLGWADPDLNLAVAYLTTGVQVPLVNHLRMTRLSDAVLEACARPDAAGTSSDA